MTKLIRDGLRNALHASRAPHAGLLLNRGLKEYISGNNGAGLKATHIRTLCEQQPSDIYRLAFERWQSVTRDSQCFSGWYGQVDGRLLIGLATGGALETGVITSHSYGMPLIPGSSVKGMARAHALQLKVPAEYLAVLFGEDEEVAKGSDRLAGAGSLVWHDAWWCSSENKGGPFVEEVVTVHHQAYYSGTGAATDFDSPVPNAQIAVQGSFYFVIEGDPAWARMAMSLLQQALTSNGIGAKRAAGYGFMAADDKANQQEAKAKEKARLQTMTPEQQARDYLRDLTGDELAKRFGTDQVKTLKQFSNEVLEVLPCVGREMFASLLDKWAAETKKTNKSRYRARKYFMGQDSED